MLTGLDETDRDALERAERTGEWGEVARLIDRLEPDAVVGAVLRSGTGWADLPDTVAATLSAAHHLRTADPRDRGLLRELAGGPPRDSRYWRVRWTDRAVEPPHLVVAANCDPYLLTTVPLPGNRSLLAYAADDRAVELWDPLTASVTHRIRTRADITAMAAVLLPGGGPLLAVAGGKAVQIYDAATGKRVGKPIVGHEDKVTSLCWITMRRRIVLVTGGDKRDPTIRLWSTAGLPIGDPIDAGKGDGRVYSIVAWPQPDGQTLLATVWAGYGGPYRTIDPATGTQLGDLDHVTTLAPVPMPDRTLLVTTDRQHAIHVWEPVTGKVVSSAVDVEHSISDIVAVPTPDGRTLLAVTEAHTIRLLDPGTGATVRLLATDAHDARTLAALPIPGGRTLLASSGADDTVRVWHPEVSAPPRSDRDVHDLAALPVPGGRTLLAERDHHGALTLRDIETGAPTGTEVRADGRMHGAVAVPMGGRTLLASGTMQGEMVLFDPLTGERVDATPPGHEGEVVALAVGALPAGRTVLASGATNLLLWDLDTGEGRMLERYTSLSLVALSWLPLPNGTVLLVAGTEDYYGRKGTVELWDPVTRTRFADPVAGPAVSALTTVPMEGRAVLAVAHKDGTVWFWDPDGADLPRIAAPAPVTTMAAFELAGRTVLATAGADRTVQVWDTATGAAVDCGAIAARGVVTALAPLTLPDGRTLLAVAGGRRIVRWDPAAGAEIGKPMSGHTGAVLALTAVTGPDGAPQFASAGKDHTVRRWDAVSGSPIGEPAALHTEHVTALAAVPGGSLVSAGKDRMVWVSDGADGRALTGVHGYLTGVDPLPMPDGRTVLAVSYEMNPLQPQLLWDPETRTGRPLPGLHSGATAVVPMPDGTTRLATTYWGRGVQLCDPVTGELSGPQLDVNPYWVRALVVVEMPDGLRLLQADGDTGDIRLWNPFTGVEVATLAGHTRGVWRLRVLRRDGRPLLVSAGWDGTLRLWDLVTGECLQVLGLGEPVLGLAVDGDLVVAAGDNGIVALDLLIPAGR